MLFLSHRAPKQASKQQPRCEWEICFAYTTYHHQFKLVNSGYFVSSAHLNKIGRWLTCCNTYSGARLDFRLHFFCAREFLLSHHRQKNRSQRVEPGLGRSQHWYLHYEAKRQQNLSNYETKQLINLRSVSSDAKELRQSFNLIAPDVIRLTFLVTPTVFHLNLFKTRDDRFAMKGD